MRLRGRFGLFFLSGSAGTVNGFSTEVDEVGAVGLGLLLLSFIPLIL